MSEDKKEKLKQLTLFQIIEDKPDLVNNTEEHQSKLDNAITLFRNRKEDYSNMIDVWDLLPRYYLSNKQVEKIEFPWRKIRDAKYQVTLRPVAMKADPNSKTISGPIKVKYPGLREMYVEEALTKLAAVNFRNSLEAKEIELSDSSKQYLVSVKFTLYGLQKELTRVGHTYSLDEIKEALMILNESTMYIKAETRNPKDPTQSLFYEHRGPIISKLELIGEEASLSGGETLSRVVFHELKTLGVMNIAFRTYNYAKSMGLNTYLAKYIYNRLIINFLQASSTDNYTIMMNTLLIESCREFSQSIYSDKRATKTALDELVAHDILESYTEETVKENRKTVDVKFSLVPHRSFIKDTKWSNSYQRHLQHELKKLTKGPEYNLTPAEHLENIKSKLIKKK